MEIRSFITSLNDKPLKNSINIASINNESLLKFSLRLKNCIVGDTLYVRIYEHTKNSKELLIEKVYNPRLEDFTIQESLKVKNKDKTKNTSIDCVYLAATKYSICIYSKENDQEQLLQSFRFKKSLTKLAFFIVALIGFSFSLTIINLDSFQENKKTTPEMNDTIIFEDMNSAGDFSLENHSKDTIRLNIYGKDNGTINKNDLYYKSGFISSKKELANDYLWKDLDKGEYNCVAIIEYLDSSNNFQYLMEKEVTIVVNN